MSHTVHSDSLPPQNIEAEQGVIGSVLLDNGRLDAVVKILPAPDPFFRDSHQTIWRAVLDLYRDNRPVDVISLADELIRTGRFRAAGGDETLAQLANSVPHSANAEYYAEIVKQKSITRRLIEVAGEIIRDGYSNQYTAEEILAAAQSRIFDIAEGNATSRLRSVHELIPDVLAEIDRARNEGEITGLGSGWDDLDDVTGGFQPEQLIIVAGRPSMGKSMFGLNIADYIAFELEACVFFASLEMDHRSIVKRLIGARGRIDSWKIRTGNGFGYKEIDAIAQAREAMNRPLLWIDDSPSQSMLEIMASARSLARRFPLGAIVIDYIQLVEPEDPRAPRHEQVAKISRRLKQLARELKIPVIALAQLNRGPENREDHRPRMADLKESGSLEQDADIVILLHRADYYDKDREFQPIVPAEVDVAKNRNGATKTIGLALNLPCMRFEQYVPGVVEPPVDDVRF